MSEIKDKVVKEMVGIISGKKYVAGSHFDEYELALSLLGIRGLAIVDREAELPEGVFDYEQHKRIFKEAGWVKEVKDADKDK